MMRMTCHLCGLPPKTHNASPIKKKNQTNPNQGTFYKMSDQYSLKLSSSKTAVTNRKSLDSIPWYLDRKQKEDNR